MAKKEKSAMQWKVIKGVSLEALASTCEEWAADYMIALWQDFRAANTETKP